MHYCACNPARRAVWLAFCQPVRTGVRDTAVHRFGQPAVQDAKHRPVGIPRGVAGEGHLQAIGLLMPNKSVDPYSNQNT